MESTPIYLTATFAAYWGLFYLVLVLIGIKENAILRSLVLATLLLGAEWLAGLITQGVEFGWVLGTIITVAIFVTFVRLKLALPTWQLITMPIAVSIIGNVVVAVVFLAYFEYAAKNT